VNGFPLDRSALQDAEAARLAPYACRSAESRGRPHPEPGGAHAYRTEFQRDRDRVLHSRAFRRLQYKTQVFVNHEGDHYRTRLTHTLETAQIAVTIARALGLNEDLTETVALAHDLGHSPFGHAGEEGLAELMGGAGGFKHNAQTLRVVELLEYPYPDFPGLNLTHEARGCIAHKARKHAGFLAADGPPLPEPTAQPALEGQVADLADSIAYDHHDLDDGVSGGLLDPAELERLEIWRKAGQDVAARYGALPEPDRLRRTVKAVVERMVTDALHATAGRIAAMGLRSPDDARSAPHPAARFSDAMVGPVAELEQFLHARLYAHWRVARMKAKAKRIMADVFHALADDPRQLPPAFQKRAAADGVPRAVCDYIAGMTDRYCLEEHRRLFEPFERV
jgi:dGTPase